MRTPLTERAALTRKDAADYLSISLRTLDAMIDNQTIPSIKIGASRRLLRADLDAYLQAQRDAQIPTPLTSAA